MRTMAVTSVFLLVVGAASATLVTYGDQATFLAAITGEVTEDFEGLISNNSVAAAGSSYDGFTVSSPSSPSYLYLGNGKWDAGVPGWSSTYLFGDSSATLEFNFGSGVFAFGSEIWGIYSGSASFSYTLYFEDLTSVTTPSNIVFSSPGYLGFYSDKRITKFSITGGTHLTFDNVTTSRTANAATPPIPGPAAAVLPVVWAATALRRNRKA